MYNSNDSRFAGAGGLRIGDELLVLENKGLDVAAIGCPRKAERYILVLADSGSARVTVQGRELPVDAPKMVFLMPGQTYCVDEASADVSYRAIVMSQQFGDSIFASYYGSNGLGALVEASPVVGLDAGSMALASYYKLLLNVVKSPARNYMLETARHLVLSMVLFYARSLERVEKERSKKEVVFSSFCNDLHNNFHINRSLAFYAGRLGVGVKYLTEVVKERQGCTAADYIDNYVLAECKALLSSTDMPVQRISREMHFLSPSVFGKFFKRLTGMSPTEYREMTR